ncbi:hypothetical protein QAD02_013969 [Eretmocerus hayati]|uniref:Uncharacterized protein n=1 Tax=Eretmocerus hayati TaxID=131215 RepID=A0ACC2P491_9HYME|nr:hypothetical protein QAD02_013969 [Eretmocerus hayati]
MKDDASKSNVINDDDDVHPQVGSSTSNVIHENPKSPIKIDSDEESEISQAGIMRSPPSIDGSSSREINHVVDIHRDPTVHSTSDISSPPKTLTNSPLKLTINRKSPRKENISPKTVSGKLGESIGSKTPIALPKRVKLSEIGDVNVKLVLDIPRDQLYISDEILGRGVYGVVTKGEWNHTDVAVKTISVFTSRPKHILREVTYLRQAETLLCMF